MKRALVLMDLQYDFLNPFGRMPVAAEQIAPVLARIQAAAAAANAAGDPIIAVANSFARLDPANLFRRFAAVAGSAGAAWDERAPQPNAGTFTKSCSSAFSNPDFEEALRLLGIGEIVLTGVYTSGCVAATAKAGLKRGLTVSILAGATADRGDRARQSAIQRLQSAGVHVLDAYTDRQKSDRSFVRAS